VPTAQSLNGALSHDGSRLAYAAVPAGSTGFWRVPIGPTPGAESPAQETLASSATNLNIDISPDSTRFAFASNRSGGLEIWTSSIDGSSPRQITHRPGEKSGTPRWSPDGLRISFDSSTKGNSDIFVTTPTGEAPSRLTSHPAVDCNGSWSADGMWVYFGSNRTGEFQIWKIPAGGGKEIQVTRNGGFGGVESPSGDYFYYTTRFVGGELRRVPVWGGAEQTIHPAVREVHALRATSKGVYFLPPCPECDRRSQPQTLLMYRFPNGPVETVARFRLAVRMGFDVSSDGSFLIVNAIRPPVSQSRNIILVEGLK
jgi:dipeptidyl aminopeptidase/acylaminoacyl peptidase